ncbi:MAG: prepilin-type N-terminal cleavage/methylation domain-containing protein [Candidatus Wallbacteria bacterium]|nr:prepilin-type N-terminal cleavage/methylation domain-containing protein [Candidatus Wallbacteria bacterium]
MMRPTERRRGFTIIELLIVVIVIGILAAAGLAKYQNFAETSRRKTCLQQLHALETGMAVWETTNTAFAENSKCAWGFTPRTGKLTDTAITPVILNLNTSGTIAAIADANQTVGGPPGFYNSGSSGPLGTVIRDDNIWDCPSALSRYYGGEIQNVNDDYMDTTGGGVSPVHGGTAIGLGGRYFMCNGGNTVLNGGYPPGWITGNASATTSSNPTPCPQKPFKVAICGSYGTFGTGSGTSNVPGTNGTNQGGPVGPDGSSLNRHSSRR